VEEAVQVFSYPLVCAIHWWHLPFALIWGHS